MTAVILGVYDKSRKVFCVRCWSKEPRVSTASILLGEPAAEQACSDCGKKLNETFPSEETTMIRVVLDAEKSPAWSDLQELDKRGKLVWLDSPVLSIARLPGGMRSGVSSVSIRIDLPDGTCVVAETSMKLFLGCAKAFKIVEEDAS